MRIKIIPAAENDLNNGYEFYESQTPGLGTYFLDSLFSDIDSLAYFAGIHQKVFGYYRLLSKRFPFAVYYRIVEKSVVVYAALDCRRSPSWMHKRLVSG